MKSRKFSVQNYKINTILSSNSEKNNTNISEYEQSHKKSKFLSTTNRIHQK